MEGNEVHSSKRAYMWLFASGRKEKAIFVYKFATTQAGSVSEEFLDKFKRFLQTDRFSGYIKWLLKMLLFAFAA